MRDLSNDTILHIAGNGQNYIQFRRLLEFPELVHRFTLKPLDFMSSHPGNAQEAEAVTAQDLGISAGCFCKPQQTHSDHIRIVGRQDAGILPPQLTDTDGLITDQKGLALLLTFADCTPLLFYDPKKRVIANIHSGWKGTLARIGAKAVLRMSSEFGCDPADLICCIGPHIRSCCFEVDRDVADLFRTEFSDLAAPDPFISSDPDRGKYFIDTCMINRELLKKAGLAPENIIDSGICTKCNSDLCHSYRADKNESGRSAAVIFLQDRPSA